MSFQDQTTSDILETDDKIISSLFIVVLFIAMTSLVIGFIASNTGFFSIGNFTNILLQFLLLIVFLFVIAILANYKGLDLLQDYAYPILKICYTFMIGVVILSFAGSGLLLAAGGSIFGFGLIGISVLGIFLISKFWGRLMERLKTIAEWLRVSATVVLNEPGMILLSFVQSLVIGITAIVEIVTYFAWTQYAEASGLAESTGQYMGYLIMFLYLWLTFIILYYFDGANTFIAYSRVKGSDPKVGQGLNASSNKLLAIAVFALVSATVMIIVRLIYRFARRLKNSASESDNITGVIFATIMQVIAGLVQYIYYLLTFFTLPAIIIRQKSAKEAMIESKNLFAERFWDVILGDMGYSYGATIIYLFTGLILGASGFVYGYFILATTLGFTKLITGIIIGGISLVFGLFVSRFFLKPLHTSLVTTMYTYATEGESALKLIPTELKSYLNERSQSKDVIRA